MLYLIRDLCKGNRDLFQDTDLTKANSPLFDELMQMGFNNVPCLFLDFANLPKSNDLSEIDYELQGQMQSMATSLNVMREPGRDASWLLRRILEKYVMSGKQIVVLLDEVDTPLIYSSTTASEEAIGSMLAGFLRILKGHGAVHFSMMTGIYNLPMYISHDTNQFHDLSADQELAEAWGFTEGELMNALDDRYRSYKNKEEMKAETMKFLKENYNGYNFVLPRPTKPVQNLIHPWQTWHYLRNEGGPVPRVLLNPRDKVPFELIDEVCRSDRVWFDRDTVLSSNDDPNLWWLATALNQCGILSIASNTLEGGNFMTTFKLTHPKSLLRVLASFNPVIKSLCEDIVKSLNSSDIHHLEQQLNDFFDVQKSPILDSEKTLQGITEAVFNLCHIGTEIEVVNRHGIRSDLVVSSSTAFYIFELKFQTKRPKRATNSREKLSFMSTAAKNALKQIEKKSCYSSVIEKAQKQNSRIIEVALIYWKEEQRCIELAANEVKLEGKNPEKIPIYPMGK